MAQNFKKFCHTSYLRNHTSWLSFMVHLSKVMISPGVFFIFSKFWFCKLLVHYKFKKMTQNGKKLCCASCLRNYTSFYCNLWYTCVWNDVSKCSFTFSKFWIFWVVKGVKSCLSCSISQEPYIIWLSFMVHMCKMTISPGWFFIFSFWFSGVLLG